MKAAVKYELHYKHISQGKETDNWKNEHILWKRFISVVYLAGAK